MRSSDQVFCDFAHTPRRLSSATAGGRCLLGFGPMSAAGWARLRCVVAVGTAGAVTAVLLAVVALTPGASAQTVGDVAQRDRLIAAQENLLNTYRCLFGVDTGVVPGGCPDPYIVSPGPAPDTPTQQDVDARDALIESQEALLNVYRCRFDVDTEVVPGGCVDGEPFDPTGPLSVPDSSLPPARPTGFAPGDTGPGFTVDENGRVRLTRLMTPYEGLAAYVEAGHTRDIAEQVWAGPSSGQGSIGGIRGSDGGRYPYTNPLMGVSAQRMLEWAQACVTAYEDAGVPAHARSIPADGNLFRRVAETPAGLAAFCGLGVLNSGLLNHATSFFGVSPDCIVDHLIEFMPVRAGRFMGRSYADMGYHRLDFWWGNHCGMRVSHPLGSELVLGPFGTTGNWTEAMYGQVESELLGDWSPRHGTRCSTGIGTKSVMDIDGIQRPRIDSLVLGTLWAINTGRSCWLPGTAPWTEAELDRLGADYTVAQAGGRYPAGTLLVPMRFLPDPFPTEHRFSPPASVFFKFARN